MTFQPDGERFYFQILHRLTSTGFGAPSEVPSPLCTYQWVLGQQNSKTFLEQEKIISSMLGLGKYAKSWFYIKNSIYTHVLILWRKGCQFFRKWMSDVSNNKSFGLRLTAINKVCKLNDYIRPMTSLFSDTDWYMIYSTLFNLHINDNNLIQDNLSILKIFYILNFYMNF